MKKGFLCVVFLVCLPAVLIFAADKPWYHKTWKEMSGAGRFEEAVEVFKRAVKEYPDEAWFYVFIAHSLKKLDRAEDAMPFYEKAFELAPVDEGIVQNVYSGYLAYAAHVGFGLREWEKAGHLYKKAIEILPLEAAAYNLYGNTMRVLGMYQKAYAAFEKAYKLDPAHVNGNLRANFRAGMIQGMTGSDNQSREYALLYADLAVAAYPDDEGILLQAFELYASARESGRALSLMEKAGSETTRLLMKGYFHLTAGREAEAEELFDDLSSKTPDDYTVDDRVAKFYRSLVEDLPYEAQMSSPYQARAVDYNTRAVVKYFRVNPYSQEVVLYPPLRGRFELGQGAGGKSYHNGLKGHYSFDLTQEMGASIFSVSDGIVTNVEDTNLDNPVGSAVNLDARGNIIEIKAGNIMIKYVHLKHGSSRVSPGDKVRSGDLIGEIGNSGVSAGPHLHFVITNSDGVTLPVLFTGLQSRPGGFQDDWRPAETLETGYEYLYEPVP
ncbi:MAG TPA: tetratricopeptide repeat protein [Spirochaetes bacterium]|nr:tetratricopeptide repeat protein [Spirochaetota bacterium]